MAAYQDTLLSWPVIRAGMVRILHDHHVIDNDIKDILASRPPEAEIESVDTFEFSSRLRQGQYDVAVVRLDACPPESFRRAVAYCRERGILTVGEMCEGDPLPGDGVFDLYVTPLSNGGLRMLLEAYAGRRN